MDHKKWVSQVFDRAASQYGSGGCEFFNYFGRRLVEQVKVLPGQKILDVATGRGAVLFPLAEAVGPSGQVIGIDISRQMIKETSVEVLERNLHWVELHHMDAEHLSFPDHTFDFVFCGFALFFMPSLSKALSEFKRVLKPGGKLAVSIWGQDSELNTWINEEIKKVCSIKSLAATSVWSERELREALDQAQFQNIQIFEETKRYHYSSSEEWWNSLWTHGSRAKFEQLSSDQLAQLKEKTMALSNLNENRQVFYGIARK